MLSLFCCIHQHLTQKKYKKVRSTSILILIFLMSCWDCWDAQFWVQKNGASPEKHPQRFPWVPASKGSLKLTLWKHYPHNTWKNMEKYWKIHGKTWKNIEKYMEKHGKYMENIEKYMEKHGKYMENIENTWKIWKNMENMEIHGKPGKTWKNTWKNLWPTLQERPSNDHLITIWLQLRSPT